MYRDLFINAVMLVAFVSVIFQLFRNSGINPLLPLSKRILVGIAFGLLGFILVLFSVSLPYNIIIDFRILALILSAICGGWISAIITSVVIAISRICIQGVNEASILAIAVLFVITACFCFIIRLKIQKHWKWIISVVISDILASVVFINVIEDSNLERLVVITYVISFSVMSFLLYFYTGYIETLTESYRQLKNDVNRDYLTGLNNVRRFDTVFNTVTQELNENPKGISLLYIDIDSFKKINDTYGHKEGDIVLKTIGEILVTSCRNTDIVSRIGGDEFSVVLQGCAKDEAVSIAELMRKKAEIHQIDLSDRKKIRVTISIGVASYPDPVREFDLLIEKADGALYEAKRSGRNKVVLSQ